MICEPSKFATAALITLPAPLLEGEIHYCAFVFRPLRVSPLFFIQDRTRVFILEKSGEKETDTELYIVTRKQQKEKEGAGLAPRLGEFYEFVISQLNQEG